MIRILLALLFGTVAAMANAADVKLVKIVHVETGKVLAIEGDSEEPEAHAVIAKEGDTKSGEWKVEKDGDYLKLVNAKSGKVLDVNNNSTDEDASIIQWESKDEGTDNKRWSWDGTGDEKRLVSKHSKMAVVPDSDGKLIQKKVDDKAKGQLWKVVEVKK